MAPKGAVFVHNCMVTFLGVKQYETFINKSFSQLKVSILLVLKHLNVVQFCESYLCPVLHLLVKCLVTKLRTNKQIHVTLLLYVKFF